jgi:hypothetical protein
MTAERRRMRDLIAAGLFIGLIVFLFWPSGNDQPETDAAPDGVSEVETPSVESTAEPTQAAIALCDVDDAHDVLRAWVDAINSGDRETLEVMLPDSGAPSPSTASYPSMDHNVLHSFTVHESGQMAAPGDVIDYLEERHTEHNESWRVQEVGVQRMSRGHSADGLELDRLSVRFARSADDLPDHEVTGEIIMNCHQQQVLMVVLETDAAELALPIPVEEFLGAVGPYGTGEMRDLRMIVSTDVREDTGSLARWDIRRIEANSMSGQYVESVEVSSINNEQIVQYTYDGSNWYLENRGWREMGSLTGWNTLPLEIMLTRGEPSHTADVLRSHIEEIPDEGTATFSGEFEVREELQRAVAMVPRSESVDGVIEVEVQDGNLVRTRYRLVDRQLGTHSSVPDIQWVHIKRRDRYDPQVFVRPPGFEQDEQQFQPPPDLAGQLELVERTDHQEGVGERFELEWNGNVHELLVTPSRGPSHENSLGDEWPLTWDREWMLVDDHMVTLAGPDLEQFPEAVLWDTGEYRYELRIAPDFAEQEMLNAREIVETLLEVSD